LLFLPAGHPWIAFTVGDQGADADVLVAALAVAGVTSVDAGVA
jgi:hypothetical protein